MVISQGSSSGWYYPIDDEKNSTLYARYRMLADNGDKVIFSRWLGEYKYYDVIR